MKSGAADHKKIFANHISDREHIYETKNLHNTKVKTNPFVKGAKVLKAYDSPVKILGSQ